ncbi:XRE family transcriptional regulator [Caldimonas brevitalea]|uniref:Transcriptional regulator yidN, Cro/CI family n=1 Tax=Caldimonas brevitalea TaxID=413882 RepID=A0A0G3BP67_9BURK|nr:XRE family transcriptional regulator [Caldimonas brevitalea]AKJ31249.1 transcriptional regulator yidN, Cro/CI family [Caldimonas brevitalea]
MRKPAYPGGGSGPADVSAAAQQGVTSADGLSPSSSETAPGLGPRDLADAGLAQLVGDHLKRLRRQRRWSLERLARASGVSRAMLGQLEQGRSVPSVRTLWLIAASLDVSLTSFLQPRRQPEALVLPVDPEALGPLARGTGHRRALFAHHRPLHAEFHELRLATGASVELGDAEATQVLNVVVVQGELEVTVGEAVHLLGPREAVQFEGPGGVRCSNLQADEVLAFWVTQTRHPLAALSRD